MHPVEAAWLRLRKSPCGPLLHALVPNGRIVDRQNCGLAVALRGKRAILFVAVLRDLKTRSLQAQRLLAGDGHLGIWAGLRNVDPEAQEQRCWNHRIVNALDTGPTRRQAEARLQLTQIPYAETAAEAERLKAGYQHWCRKRRLEAAATVLDRDWERMRTCR